MAFLFRLISLLCLAGAVMSGAIDSVRSVAASAVIVTPFSEFLGDISPNLWTAVEGSASYYIHPRFYALVVAPLMAQPAFALLLVLSLLFWMVGYRRPVESSRYAS